jgi:4-alpha-glucanotransferase
MDSALLRLAEACGVATSYEDWARRPVAVSEQTVRSVLAGLGIDATDPAAALAEWQERSWQRVLAPTVVIRQGFPAPFALRSPRESAVRVELVLAGRAPVELTLPLVSSTAADRVERLVPLPAGLPTGDHRLVAYVDELEVASALLVVAPDQLPLPDRRLWGWMVQLYAVRTAWGMGDYADLAQLAGWSGEQGAGLLLVNPLHAVAPVVPLQNSPYFPASRRFSSPLYLRPERLPEYAAAGGEIRAQVDALAAGVIDGERIDRDAVWAAKSAALELLFPFAVKRSGAEDSAGLTDFATWSALVEQHGPDFRVWPLELRDPRGESAVAAREQLAERVAYHRWLQHCCVEQLAAAQEAASAAGMPVGIVHDLAVGVDPGGADAWALREDLAAGFSIGAPPDSFNQQGQDWGLPPWRPDRLLETGYQPIRDIVRAVLRTGGGLRIDHILGLFRLWWVPAGSSSAQGTYVSYDAEALLGILALEAERAGALVVGEDLGTVPPTVRTKLSERAVLGSTVVWFERDDDGHLVPPQQWRAAAVASVTTHDLPTSAGFLTGDHVRVRGELGLLSDPAAEARNATRERTEMLELLVSEGLLAPDEAELATPQSSQLADQVVALHELLGLSPSRVLLASLSDAVGDLRQPNMPGTVDEYPNWRLPVADRNGMLLTREELCAAPGTARLAAVMREAVARVVVTAKDVEPADGSAKEGIIPNDDESL